MLATLEIMSSHRLGQYQAKVPVMYSLPVMVQILLVAGGSFVRIYKVVILPMHFLSDKFTLVKGLYKQMDLTFCTVTSDLK